MLVRKPLLSGALTSVLLFDASGVLHDSDERWEAALIVNNITNYLTSGSCVNANVANGAVYGGVETGSNSRGSAGVEAGLQYRAGPAGVAALQVVLSVQGIIEQWC